MFKIIKQSTTGVRQTFGKFSGFSAPGLTFYIPYIQKITPISNRLSQNNFKFEIKTKDNVFAFLHLALQYHVIPEDSANAYFSMDNPHEQLTSYIENNIRSYASTKTIDELFESHDEICKEIHDKLHDKMKQNGYTIVNTLITNIDPDKEVKDAMNKINSSARLKLAIQNAADAHYITEIRQAEADRDRKILQGEGISGQRIAILKGYESGVNNMSKNLGLTPKDIIEFVMRTQHLDTLESIGTSPNTKTLFMNHDIDHYGSQMIKAQIATQKEEEK